MAFPLSDDEAWAIQAMIEAPLELVVAAAIRVPFGDRFLTLSVERPGRHGNLIYAAGLISGDRQHGGEHGFLTSQGRFVTRREAGDIVHLAEQGSTRDGCNGNLFSEDMWNDPAKSSQGVSPLERHGNLPPDEPNLPNPSSQEET